MTESRYATLARTLRKQIEMQVWLPGDRLPSLRDTCKQSGLSLMTVLQAYQLLESQGVIVARPQSGYYVAAGLQRPVRHQPDERLHAAEQIDVNDAIFDILKAGQDPAVVPLGSAFPDPTLFPQPRLARSLASAVRRMSPHSATANLPPGNEELRRSIAQRYAQNGIEVAPDEIVITSGAMESLGLSLQMVTDGDWVAIESSALRGFAAIERRKLKAVAIRRCAFGMIRMRWKKRWTPYPIKLLADVQFQNPLGARCRLRQMRLVEILQAHQVAIIEDDVYSELYFGSERAVPLKATPTQRNSALFVIFKMSGTGFSRRLGGGGGLCRAYSAVTADEHIIGQRSGTTGAGGLFTAGRLRHPSASAAPRPRTATDGDAPRHHQRISCTGLGQPAQRWLFLVAGS